jgi:hypothetical protein
MGAAVGRVPTTRVIVRACVLMLTLTGFGTASAGAQACTKAWGVGSGSWTTAANWIPAGMPGPADDVCISAHGTYTVTVPVLNGGAQVRSLAVGALAGGGTQTLLILGQSVPLGGGILSGSSVTATTGGTIGETGQIVLDATDQGTPAAPNEQAGGPATLAGGPFTNEGSLVAQSESTQPFRDYLRVPFTNASGGTVHVTSGFLDYTGGLTFQNNGTLTSDGSGWFLLESDLPLAGPRTHLINAGAVVKGNMEVDNADWTQAGGSVTGSALKLLNGNLDYQAGTGSFDMSEGFGTPTGSLSGTIPAGQTVTAEGGSFGLAPPGHTWTLQLVGDQVVNRGTLQLASVAGVSALAGSASVQGAPLVNFGTILATSTRDGSSGSAAPYPSYLRSDLTNEPGGVVDVESVLAQDSGTTTLNEGTISFPNGGLYLLSRAAPGVTPSTVTNAPDGSISMQLDAFSTPVFAVSSGGAFNAAGALQFRPSGSYVPQQNHALQVITTRDGAFAGRFGSVGSGFTADYTHRLYVRVVFGNVIGAISGGRGALAVSLTCPPGGPGCPRVTVRATAPERHRVTIGRGKHRLTYVSTRRVVVATSSASTAAGRSRTFTLRLNRAGRRLLAHAPAGLVVRVVVTSQGRTLALTRVRVRRL